MCVCVCDCVVLFNVVFAFVPNGCYVLIHEQLLVSNIDCRNLQKCLNIGRINLSFR